MVEFDALILSAGYGKRLGKLTVSRPKPLIEVKGKPLIYYVIRKVIEAGAKKIFINTHYLHHMLEEYILNQKFDIEIEIIYEKNILNSGGGIRNVYNKIKSDHLLIHNCDIISDIDIKEMFQYHLKNSSSATLAIQKRVTKRYLLFDNQSNFLGRYCEGLTGEKFGFQGIHFMDKRFIEPVSREPLSIIDYYCNSRNLPYIIKGFEMKREDLWKDLGRIEDLYSVEGDSSFSKIWERYG